MTLYVSMHSYASFILYPYSFDKIYISNWQQHEKLCKIYADTVNEITKFHPYSFGHSATKFYPATGVSDDFAVGVVKSKFSIVIELPGGGDFGYDFEENELQVLVNESFIGLKAIGVYLSQN